jgi:hypothetical protein
LKERRLRLGITDLASKSALRDDKQTFPGRPRKA